jgi:TP901-1 family phage major tail protein
MATTGLVNGTLIALYKTVSGADVKVANLTSTDFELSKDTIDATNKDGGDYKEFLVGLSGWTMSAEGIFEEDASVGTSISPKELLDDIIAGAPITVVMTSKVSGDLKLSGSAVITSFAWSAPVNDIATFSVSLQGSGALTVAVVTP